MKVLNKPLSGNFLINTLLNSIKFGKENKLNKINSKYFSIMGNKSKEKGLTNKNNKNRKIPIKINSMSFSTFFDKATYNLNKEYYNIKFNSSEYRKQFYLDSLTYLVNTMRGITYKFDEIIYIGDYPEKFLQSLPKCK